LVGLRTWLFRAAYFACVVGFLVGMSGYYREGVGFTTLILFGDQFEKQALPEVQSTPHYVFQGPGYDGQFYAQLAVRPNPWDANVRDALDNPWYRSGRILPSFVACGLSAGRPSWTLNVYAVQNIVVWLLSALLLLRWFPPGTLSDFVAWAGTVFSAGLMMAVCRALPDAWALLLLLAGLTLLEHRSRAAPFVLGLSGFAKETSLAAVFVFFDAVPRKRLQVLELARRFALATAPTLAWLALLRLTGGRVQLSEGAFAFPFAGLVQRMLEFPDDWRNALIELSVPVAILGQALFFLLRWRPSEYRWRLGIAYVPLLALLGESVWQGYPIAAARVLLPLTLAFNLAMPRGVKPVAHLRRRYPRRWGTALD
jgi:hypothetical protein